MNRWHRSGALLWLALCSAGCAEEEAVAPHAQVAAAASPARPGTCGAAWEGSAQPCALQQWMRDHVGKAMADEDLPAVAEALDLVARGTPDDTWTWTSIAARGAASARARDAAEVRAACRECHERYRPTFKRLYRDCRPEEGPRTLGSSQGASVTQD